MNLKSAATAYREEAFENAPPLKIVRLLYQGALRFIDRAKGVPSNSPAFHSSLLRADEIVAELRCALDESQAPQLVDNLRQLYLFVECALQRAIREKRVDELDGARAVLVKLLEAWSEVEVQAQVEAPAAEEGRP